MGWSPRAFDPLGLEKLEDGKRTLVQNVMALLDSDHKRSSFSLVCRLSCLTPLDLENFFLDISVLFWRQVPNAVLAFQDMASVLSRGGIAAPLGLMKKVLEGESRHRGIDEQRVKALIRVAESTGEYSIEFVGLVRTLLSRHMETDSKLFLFRFIYGKTQDRRIIDEALRFESRKIRSWARNEEAKRREKQRPGRETSRESKAVPP